MRKLIFISRHTPTLEQEQLARKAGYEIKHIGDIDAFNDSLVAQELHLNKSEGVAVCAVHPLITTKATVWGMATASFRNVNRAPVGEKPDFRTDMLKVITPHYGYSTTKTYTL